MGVQLHVLSLQIQVFLARLALRVLLGKLELLQQSVSLVLFVQPARVALHVPLPPILTQELRVRLALVVQLIVLVLQALVLRVVPVQQETGAPPLAFPQQIPECVLHALQELPGTML